MFRERDSPARSLRGMGAGGGIPLFAVIFLIFWGGPLHSRWGGEDPEPGRSDEKEIRSLLEEARILEARGDFESALKLYRYLLSLYGEIPDVEERYAVTLGWAGKYGDALAIFDRILEREPGKLSILFERAKVLLWKGDFERAGEEFLALKRSYLSSSGGEENDLTRLFSLYLARVFREKKEYESSLIHYRIFLEGFPSDLDARMEYAWTLAWSGAFWKAKAEFEAILRVDPERDEALSGLALTHNWAGDPLTSYHILQRMEREGRLAPGRVKGEAPDLRGILRPATWMTERFYFDSDYFLLNETAFMIDTFIAPLFEIASQAGYSIFADYSREGEYLTIPHLVFEIKRSFLLNGYGLLKGGFRYHSGESSFFNPVAGGEVGYRFSKRLNLSLHVDSDDAVFDVTTYPSARAGLFLLNSGLNLYYEPAESWALFLTGKRGEFYPERNSRNTLLLDISRSFEGPLPIRFGLISYLLNYLRDTALYWDPALYVAVLPFLKVSPFEKGSLSLDFIGGAGPAFEKRQDGGRGYFVEYYISTRGFWEIHRNFRLEGEIKFGQSVREGYYRSLTILLGLCYKF